MPTIDHATIRKSKRRDRLARWLITLGGVTIIASVVAILLLILGVTFPLFRPARAQPLARTRLPADVSPVDALALGVELGVGEQAIEALVAYIVGRDGSVRFLDLQQGGSVLKTESLVPPGRDGAEADLHIIAVQRHNGSLHTLLWSDGSVSLVDITAVPEFNPQGRRSMSYSVRHVAQSPPNVGPIPTAALMRIDDDGSVTCARLLPGNRLSVEKQVREEDLLGNVRSETRRTVLDDNFPGNITALTMDTAGATLYAGTDAGRILRWEIDASGAIKIKEIVPAFRDRRTITSLSMVLGDVSLAVGDSRGGLSSWFEVGRGGNRRLQLVHRLRSHTAGIAEIHASQRNKGLLSLGEDGGVHLDHTTSERHLLTLNDTGSPLRTVGFSLRGNAVVALTADGELAAWQIDNPHPEISWKTLFGKVLYEGYSEPDYAWQTTGGAEFEPKFSLAPILFGTIKGTFYAMLLAAPLALFGAAYTSHFTTPRFKSTIKPVVEVMAAIPSVVIGFLIALWLAPIIERWILAVFASMATVPLAFVLFMMMWQVLRKRDWAKRIETGYEFLVMIPVLVVGFGLAAAAVPFLEEALFNGNFKLWLHETLAARYDQRNSIIIAFGLGFAVIPIIFSIAEDSLSSVPHNLTAASMALGASRWQTMWRVVLPSGSPGIFAGTMIGFGRAVGETMIVLMATGNTPILDWSPLNGMRTLSANIAVEIPEAPVGGTLYRVLFLCAVLLFILTFLLNTVAELVRQRLRKRYGRL